MSHNEPLLFLTSANRPIIASSLTSVRKAQPVQGNLQILKPIMSSLKAQHPPSSHQQLTSAVEIVEMENIMALDQTFQSKVMPRWERKKLQRMSSTGSDSNKMSANDRFIPNRAAMHIGKASHTLAKENSNPQGEETVAEVKPVQAAASLGSGQDMHKQEYRQALKASLLDEEADFRVLAFREKAPLPKAGHHNSLQVLYSQNKHSSSTSSLRSHRHIPSAPERILDAPDMLDDFYLNIMDWGASNILAIALTRSLYLWNVATGEVTELMSMPDGDDCITSVSWIQETGSHLAVGTASAQTQLWDVAAQRQVRSMGGHAARVSSLAWNKHILSSGSRDSTIVHHDVRMQQHHVATLAGHEQEVCGLAWSPDGSLLASGGNDNLLCIWDGSSLTGLPRTARTLAPRYKLAEHQAAVKALAWCPYERNVLATGGGTADRSIKFWNGSNGAMLQSVDTGSQVCSLLWSKTEKELLSSHGYSENQLCLWKYPSMVKVKEFCGHTSRVLHLAQSPDGATVASAAPDETIRLWNIFMGPGALKKKGDLGGITVQRRLSRALHISS